MSEKRSAAERDSRFGLICGIACYSLWGFLPLYWDLLGNVPAFEVMIHRMLWCAVAMAAVIIPRGQFPGILRAIKSPRLVATLAASALMISTNWGIYIWCVETRQIVEASLGYFINPLIVLCMGVLLLGEKMTPLRWLAMALGTIAVAVQTLALGHFPFIAFILALMFAIYGYLRKTASIGAMEGLFVESALSLPITLGLVFYWAHMKTGSFGTDLRTTSLLMLSGPITAVPLALFAVAARRLRFSTVGFLQYLAPVLALNIAIFLFHERVTWVHVFTFACIWSALIVLTLDGMPKHLRDPRNWARRKTELAPTVLPLE